MNELNKVVIIITIIISNSSSSTTTTMNLKLIIAVINTTCLSSCELKPEKNSGLNGIRAHDLCDTGAVL